MKKPKKDKPYISSFDTDWSKAVTFYNGKPKANQDHFNWLHHRNAYLSCDRTTELGRAIADKAFQDMLDSVTLENPPPRPESKRWNSWESWNSWGFRLWNYWGFPLSLCIGVCLISGLFISWIAAGIIAFMLVAIFFISGVYHNG